MIRTQSGKGQFPDDRGFASCEHMEGQSRCSQMRRGAVTVVALVVLLILGLLVGQFVRRVLMERRQIRQEVQHMQAEKLADAGLRLAVVSRQKDPAWTGTTWNVQAGTIHQTNTAEVTIRMQEETCTVIARYPANSQIPLQVTRTRKLSP
jgi:Tfp pilus assembly protein PilX